MFEPATPKNLLSLIIPFHVQLPATSAAQSKREGQISSYSWLLRRCDPHYLPTFLISLSIKFQQETTAMYLPARSISNISNRTKVITYTPQRTDNQLEDHL